jgi:hypothetical protein
MQDAHGHVIKTETVYPNVTLTMGMTINHGKCEIRVGQTDNDN